MPYIEKDFPIERLNEIAKKEGNAKKPIYQIHKWWARRLSSVFRSILLTSFLTEDITEDEFWKDYFYKKTDLKEVLGYSPIVLDPFMGGGTTVIEALRLGAKVIGIDINPVAWFVTKKEIEPLDLKQFDEEFKNLKEKVGKNLKEYYKTKCPKCQIKRMNRNYEWNESDGYADIMYVFWVNKVKCLNPYCGKEVHLYPSFKIATKKTKKEGINHTVFCPECHHIFQTKTDKKEVECPDCSFRFIPNQGYVSRGTYACQYCNQKYKVLDSVKKSGKIPDREMYAIEYYCKTHGRGYKPVDDFDKALFENAKEEFEKKKGELIGRLIPDQVIPDGYNTKQMKNFGYKYFYEMFNERQLLCLSMLLEEILKIEDENVREFMLLTFSSSLDWNNMFGQYNITARKNQPLFGRHVYWPLQMPSENNIWGTEYGSGPFITHIKKLKNGKKYCTNPSETTFDSKGNTVKKYTDDLIIGSLSSDFTEFTTVNKDTILKCHTSEDLSFIPEKSVNAVITDPPYYDNVMYSELADFFYIWLRLGLKSKYPWFRAETTRNKREIIKNEVQNKDENFFLKGIKRVFTECNRVLKDNGIFIFTFHHKETKAWASILHSVIVSGYYVSAIYPIHSETSAPTHILGMKSISYDTIIVCRKRKEKPREVSWSTLKSKIYHNTKEVIERLHKKRPHLREGDIFVIALGIGLEIYSKNYPSVLYKEGYLEPEDATKLMSELVDTIIQEIKESELPSGLDEVSKIYIGYLVGEKYVDYDYLNKILRGRSLYVSNLEKEKLISKKKKNEYLISGASKRFSFIEEKIKENLDLTYVDKIHYLLHLYRRGNPIMKYVNKWKDEVLSLTMNLYCEKTKSEDCRKLHEIMEKYIEMKMPTLESYGDD